MKVFTFVIFPNHCDLLVFTKLWRGVNNFLMIFLMLFVLMSESENVMTETARVEVEVEMLVQMPLHHVELLTLDGSVTQGALVGPGLGVPDGVPGHQVIRLLLGGQLAHAELVEDAPVESEERELGVTHIDPPHPASTRPHSHVVLAEREV